jgi:hypothetical protein
MPFGPTKDRAHATRSQLTNQPESLRKAGSALGVNLLGKRVVSHQSSVVSHQSSVISKSGPEFRL